LEIGESGLVRVGKSTETAEALDFEAVSISAEIGESALKNDKKNKNNDNNKAGCFRYTHLIDASCQLTRD
jgi:hypothetical protein